MTNEMKLKIAKLEADGYKVVVTVNENTEVWNEYIKEYNLLSAAMAWCGASVGLPKSPSCFFTTEFKVTKND